MKKHLAFNIEPQPDLVTCGPTCLHAIYRFYNASLPLDRVIAEVATLEEGGTLGVHLGFHALKQGYRVTILTYNMTVFDPTWFGAGSAALVQKLKQQSAVKRNRKLLLASRAYREFLEAGGDIRMVDLTPGLLRETLNRGVPILTGLSCTYLYQAARERPDTYEEDDILGEPTGHFVVLCGYDRISRQVVLADPYHPNPIAEGNLYEVGIERLICSILLGIVTYDANLVIIEPRTHSTK